jgi:lysophospholipase L1-like esterase
MSDGDRILYVALGDDLSCAGAPASGGAWPEIVAVLLGHGIAHTNLATAGATSEEVERDQLPLAIALQPELVTLTCGANDIIAATRPDIAAFIKRFDRILWRLRQGLADPAIVTATYPALGGIGALKPRARRRREHALAALNACIRELAERHEVLLLDWRRSRAGGDPADGGRDYLDRSPQSQREIAADVVRALRRLGIGES